MKVRADAVLCEGCTHLKCEKILPVTVNKLLNGGWTLEYPETIQWQRLISLAQEKCGSIYIEH